MSQTGDMRKIPQYILPSLSQMVFLIVFIACFTGSGSFLLGDGDTGYHIRAGEIILKDLAVPRHDPFSFITPPLPWTAHEWLSEVVMAIVHNALGLPGMVFLFALLLSTTYWLLFRWIRSSGRNILVDLLILILVLLSSRIHWLARPHVFSLILIVLLYQILILHQQDRGNYLYVIPPMMLLWVHLHGGFPYGLFHGGHYITKRGKVHIRKEGKAIVPGLLRSDTCGMRESFWRGCLPIPLPLGVGILSDGPCAGIHVPQFS